MDCNLKENPHKQIIFHVEISPPQKQKDGWTQGQRLQALAHNSDQQMPSVHKTSHTA